MSLVADIALELDQIADMVVVADGHNLATEVIWSFGRFRAEGLNTIDAADAALSDWDL